MSNNKVLLMILDGWGNGRHDKADVISTVHPEYISAMTEKYPHAELRTDGENVGLPDGQMGNSEVGHLNIGAGRVVYQDLVKINRACRDNSIMQNPEVKAAFEYAKKNGVNVHFMGLVSDGGVHSSLEHLFKLCDIAAEYKIENTFVHCFMDGRDTDPRSGKGFVADLEKHMAASTGKVATVIGRYYAMDRDKRWERVKIAYDALVDGVGETGVGHGRGRAEILRRGRYGRVHQARRARRRCRTARRHDPSERPGDLLQLPQRPRQGAYHRADAGGYARRGNAHHAALLLLHDPLRRQVHGPAHPLRQGERARHHRRVRFEAGPQAAAHRRDREIRPRDVLPERRPRG